MSPRSQYFAPIRMRASFLMPSPRHTLPQISTFIDPRMPTPPATCLGSVPVLDRHGKMPVGGANFSFHSMELPVFPSIRFPRAAPTNAANTPLSPMIPIRMIPGGSMEPPPVLTALRVPVKVP